MSSVLQNWVHELTFMQQTVLLTAVRGPDNVAKYGPTKWLLRWYRRCILRSSLDGGMVLDNPWDAERGGSFMGPSLIRHEYRQSIKESSRRTGDIYYTGVNGGYERDTWQAAMDDHVSDYLRDVDALPHHFQMHFMHAAEIIGYKHPGFEEKDLADFTLWDVTVRNWWRAVYERLVHDMHVHPETEEELDRRLGDSREQWLERADPATVK